MGGGRVRVFFIGWGKGEGGGETYEVDHIDHGSITRHEHQEGHLRDIGFFNMARDELMQGMHLVKKNLPVKGRRGEAGSLWGRIGTRGGLR